VEPAAAHPLLGLTYSEGVDPIPHRGVPRAGHVFARLLGFFLCATVAMGAMLVTASPSFAHSELISTSPEEGASLTKAPTEIVLTFGEEVLEQGGAIVVTSPNGDRLDKVATLQIGGTTAGVRLLRAVDSGTFGVSYRVVSVDGHVVEGSYEYRLDLPGSAGSPTPTTSLDETSSSPSPTTDSTDGSLGTVWVLGLGAIGLVLVAAVIAVFARKRRG